MVTKSNTSVKVHLFAVSNTVNFAQNKGKKSSKALCGEEDSCEKAEATGVAKKEVFY